MDFEKNSEEIRSDNAGMSNKKQWKIIVAENPRVLTAV